MTMIPNILSCSRIVFSVLLLFCTERPVWFIILYCICGITDAADGYLARALNAETELGSKLDSLGDFVFYIAWLYIFYSYIKGENFKVTVACIVSVAVIRVANLAITKIKFAQWSMMHTIGNKIAGLALFTALPFYVFAGNVPLWSMGAIGLISALSALEETVILFQYTKYDADRKGLLFYQRNRRH